MTETAPKTSSAFYKYPPGFRARRGRNWGFLGLLYTSYYMCRYNFSIANKSISQQFGFTRADMGTIITTALFAYACGQIINGLLTDRIGGKKAMLIGATGTVIMNLVFGWASMWGFYAPAAFHGSFLYENRPSMEYVAEDFPKDPASFLQKLKSGTNASTTYVRDHLSPQARDTLFGATVDANTARATLLSEFNLLAARNDLVQQPAFSGTNYSAGAVALLHDPKADPHRLNRILLDESFPTDLQRGNHWLVKMPFLTGGLFLSLLSLFVVIRGIDGYVQAFGAPGMVKINAAWFNRRERGRFSGIFGFMINLGRFGIFNLGPALLAGTPIFYILHFHPLHWRWLFWTPAIMCAVVAIGMALTVKETPEEVGFEGVIVDENAISPGTDPRGAFRQVFLAIVTNRVVWITAAAYACTGAVRQSIDQWFPRYMQDRYHLDLSSNKFQWLAFLIPFVASAGSLSSGYISDTLFRGRRAPVAATLYFLETAVILLAAQFSSSTAAVLFLVLISFTANSTHSILGSAAPMDIGGRRMAGFALGLIDSFQYFGGSLAGYFLGRLLDKSLGNYFYFMAPFGMIGGLLMLTILGKVKAIPQPAPKAV